MGAMLRNTIHPKGWRKEINCSVINCLMAVQRLGSWGRFSEYVNVKWGSFHVHKCSVNLSSGVGEQALTTGWIFIFQLVNKQQPLLVERKMFIIHKSSLYIISYSTSKQSKLLEWHVYKLKRTYRKRLWKK